MKITLTAKELIQKSQSGKESTERLVQSIFAMYGTGAATTEMVNDEPVMVIDALEFLKGWMNK